MSDLNNNLTITGLVYGISKELKISPSYTKQTIWLSFETNDRIQYAPFDFGNEKIRDISAFGIKTGKRVTLLFSIKGRRPDELQGELRGYSGNEVMEVIKVHD